MPKSLGYLSHLVFEAALNINKRSFSQMAVPIVIFAVWGTFMSTLLTAAIVYYGSAYFTMCTSIPFVESLAFGALISSIDPIAVLSVLNNMGMSDKDPIYVLIFGESLLNDGVAIVLFQTLVHFMDSHIVIDSEAVSFFFAVDVLVFLYIPALTIYTASVLVGHPPFSGQCVWFAICWFDLWSCCHSLLLAHERNPNSTG